MLHSISSLGWLSIFFVLVSVFFIFISIAVERERRKDTHTLMSPHIEKKDGYTLIEGIKCKSILRFNYKYVVRFDNDMGLVVERRGDERYNLYLVVFPFTDGDFYSHILPSIFDSIKASNGLHRLCIASFLFELIKYLKIVRDMDREGESMKKQPPMNRILTWEMADTSRSNRRLEYSRGTVVEIRGDSCAIMYDDGTVDEHFNLLGTNWSSLDKLNQNSNSNKGE